MNLYVTLLKMSAWEIVFTVLAIIAVILVILYFVGRKLQKKQDEATAAMEQQKMKVQGYVIDKKKMKMKDANLPKAATEQIPWYAKNSKFPMVKVKIGPQMLTLIADPNVFKTIPTNKTVMLEIAGMYITAYSTGKNSKPAKAAAEPAKKKGFGAKIKDLFKKKK